MSARFWNKIFGAAEGIRTLVAEGVISKYFPQDPFIKGVRQI